MIWVAAALAMVGGLIMATTFVTDALPDWLTLSALAAWVVALMLFVALSVRESRAEGNSRMATAGRGLRTVGQFLRHFMP